ncbi:MarR family winged helix-turn-helix transcriptional regulator [Streptomyces sp. AM8-1-1]|uniref:MarR family winged helix-turn-helix transcriptional regulator n=1 Tax=Streptomyces sp. AM8-1-1 TaxID=3075825 RepID=UPI0028C4042C|nr:MarR family winged helix-turn-helix transcriptional regulator [Streptomyces sp. AM8-1-1]WNO76667.1 MarR family winged helix-turn-helix transcriptional regulator [Streptomyces sp. AM8-1-1]
MAATRKKAAPADEQGVQGFELQAFAVQLRRLTGEINRFAHEFAAHQGLHATDVQALGAIMDAPSPLTPGRLGEHLGLTSGAVTACLDRLERAGHIRRVRESPDRRVVHLHYLPEARTTARAHFLPLAQATARAQEGFTPDELLSTLRLLRAVSDELESLNKRH